MQSDVSIPIFTGTNWVQWWPSMTAYIEASGCNWVVNFPSPMLDPKADNNKHNFYISWMKANSTIIGSIKLCLLDSLKGKFQDKGTIAMTSF